MKIVESYSESVTYVQNGYRVFVKLESGVKFSLGLRAPSEPNKEQIEEIWKAHFKSFVIEAEIFDVIIEKT